MKRQKMNSSVEQHKDQTRLATMEMVFTPEECLRLIADFTPQLKPGLVEAMDPTESVSIRKSSAVFVFPNESTNWVFERLSRAVSEINDALYGFEVSEFREGFQFTRYEVGEYYGPHFDIGPGKLTERKLSMTVQLSVPEDYTGGELVIYPAFVAAKDQGSMTVFPSFMCHHVRPVKTGVRYSLVCWLAGPPFK
jgi:PKHD-type hydroxylase